MPHKENKSITMDDFSLRESAGIPGAWAVAFAFLGRVLKLRSELRKPLFRWSLLWEIPTFLGMGYLGLAIGEYMEWPANSFRTLAVIMVLGYLGPEWLERAVEKFLPLLIKK